MTAHTPIYALPYLEEGQPVRDTRLVLQQLTLAVEAALAAGGLTPPGATDYAALLGRVNELEARPRAQLRQTAAQAGIAASTWTSIVFGGEDFDTHNGHSTSSLTSRWTCPAGQAGTYLLAATVITATLPAAGTLAARLTRNGTVIPVGSGGASVASGGNLLGVHVPARLVALAVNDYLQLEAFYSGGTWSTGVTSEVASLLTLSRVA